MYRFGDLMLTICYIYARMKSKKMNGGTNNEKMYCKNSKFGDTQF